MVFETSSGAFFAAAVFAGFGAASGFADAAGMIRTASQPARPKKSNPRTAPTWIKKDEPLVMVSVPIRKERK